MYAFCVAIDDYPDPNHRLNGCVNDLQSLRSHLDRSMEASSVPLLIRCLLNEEATRSNIIEGFQHFDQAEEGDLCLFFFAGHGSRCPAPEAFWHIEPDRMHETLVCWDSRVGGNRELIDKELSYLIWKATSAKEVHFLAIMDCCHSGSNTKGHWQAVRRISDSEQLIPLSAYLGYEQYLKVGEQAYSPPRGRHVQLAASRARETAKELMIRGEFRGVFTHALVEVLSEAGNFLSYSELISRANLRIRRRVSDQTAQLFATDVFDKRLVALFGKLAVPWRMQEQIDPLFRDCWDIPRCLVAIAPCEEKSAASFARLIRSEKKSTLFDFCAVEDDPTYLVRIRKGEILLHRPFEDQPLFKRLAADSLAHAHRILRNLDIIARHHRILELSNPTSRIKEEEFHIELFRVMEPGNLEDTAAVKALAWQHPEEFCYLQVEENWFQPAFQLKITNTGNRSLWVSLLYLGDDFSISNQLIPQEELAPGEEVWAIDLFENYPYRSISLRIPDNYLQQGIFRVTEYLKVMIATEAFQTDSFNQWGLSLEEEAGMKKDILRTPQGPERDWTSREILLQIRMGKDEL